MNDTTNLQSNISPEEREKRLKRLLYRANHRGIKEMDIVLGGFANDRLNTLSSDEVDAFEELMSEHDKDLLVWFTGEADYPHPDTRAMFETIRAHLQKKNHA